MFHFILQLFSIDKLIFLVAVSISNSQNLIEWVDRRVEGYSRPEKHYESTQHS